MSVFVHGDNLEQKENHPNKYQDSISRQYLAEIREKYDEWKLDNLNLTGPTKLVDDNDFQIVEERVRLLNNYKDFLDDQKYAEKFDSRSNLHSSVLEEFMYYLFKDLIEAYSENALIGKSHSFKDIFFRCSNYTDMITSPRILIEKKDHDFVIGVTINASFQCQGMQNVENQRFEMPAVAIECKTYLDKTMLEGASAAAEQLKIRNPNAIYFVVAERLKLTDAVNLQKYKVDQIYILRKQKNTVCVFCFLVGYISNRIFEDVVWHMFSKVREYLSVDWRGNIADGIERGFLI